MEEFLHLRIGQFGIIVRNLQLSGSQSQIFRMFQDFIDAAPCLDRPGNGQMAVHFQKKSSGNGTVKIFFQRLLHGWNGFQGRFNQPMSRFRFRETTFNERSEPLKPFRCIIDHGIRYHQTAYRIGHIKRKIPGIDPHRFFSF